MGFYPSLKALSLNWSLFQQAIDTCLWGTPRGHEENMGQRVAPGSFSLDLCLTNAPLCTFVEKAQTGLLITVDNLREQKCRTKKKQVFQYCIYLFIYFGVFLFFFLAFSKQLWQNYLFFFFFVLKVFDVSDNLFLYNHMEAAVVSVWTYYYV